MLAHSAGSFHAFFQPLLKAADLLTCVVQLIFILQLLLEQCCCLNLPRIQHRQGHKHAALAVDAATALLIVVSSSTSIPLSALLAALPDSAARASIVEPGA